jgi:hypothetical protein
MRIAIRRAKKLKPYSEQHRPYPANLADELADLHQNQQFLDAPIFVANATAFLRK